MDILLIFLKYLFLGALQGFTEPIPISSSGHLVLVEHLFEIKLDGLSFEMFVNTASLLAVFVIYREDIKRLFISSITYLLKREESAKGEFIVVLYLIIATIPAGIIGILFNDFIESELKTVYTVGYSLLITAIALFIIRNLKGYKKETQITWKDALLIGIGQAVALIPGISRSGSTIVAAMLVGLNRETALRFSFLMYIPVSIGGIILEIPDLMDVSWSSILLTAYIIAFIASFIASYFSLKWFVGIMKKGKLVYFSLYCLLIGTSILVIF